MSYTEPENRGTIPVQTIHQAYYQSVEARRDFITVSLSPNGNQLLDRVHGHLNRSILQYLEIMKYELKTKDSVQEFWEGRPPNSRKQDLDEGIAYLWTNTNYKPVANGERLEELMDEAPPHHRFHKVGVENSMVIIRITQGVYGLRHLDAQWNNRKVVNQKKVGLLGIRQETSEEPQRITPDVLMRAALALDQAADKLGLLADVKRDRPTYFAGGDLDEYPEPHGTARQPE